MKKHIKAFLALVLAAGACLSLCGCRTIDTLESGRAVTDREDALVITYQGREYHRLPDEAASALDSVALGPAGYAAEAELPCLLLPSRGNRFFCSDDGSLICCRGRYYCPAEEKDALLKRLENPELDRFCVYAWITDPDNGGEYIPSYLPVDDRYTAMLNELLAMAPLSDLPEWDELNWYSWSFYRTDSSLFFTGDCFEFAAQAGPDRISYYIRLVDDDCWIPVPEGYDSRLTEMFDSCLVEYPIL